MTKEENAAGWTMEKDRGVEGDMREGGREKEGEERVERWYETREEECRGKGEGNMGAGLYAGSV